MAKTLVGILPLSLASGLASGEELPSWLEGRWCRDDAGVQIEERWMSPTRNRMLGLNQTVADGESTAFEFLRIEVGDDGVMRYLAQPGGRAPTAFAATIVTADQARFENPEHDFPQVIEYRRLGAALTATISGPGENGPLEIPFEFASCAE